MTKTAMMSHKQQWQEKAFISGEAQKHCTNKKENMASLLGNPQADFFISYT